VGLVRLALVALAALACARPAPPPAAPGAPLSRHSFYVGMRDGVRLAVDLVLPGPRRPGERLPAIVTITRYWRGTQGEEPPPGARFLAGHGYAVVLVDERGTGASFGQWRHPWSPESIEDAGELVDWIVAQPWSNGLVGATGVSYAGTTAQLLAATGRPAVRAVVPRYIELDVYADVAYPGGVFLEWLIGSWSQMIRALDLGQAPGAVRPVDGPDGPALRAAAIAEHRAAPVFDMRDAPFRDDRSARHGVTWDELSVHTRQAVIERSGAATYGWGSWLDGATADAAIRRFVTFAGPQRARIGAWSHGGGRHVSPYDRPDAEVMTPEAQAREELRFFDHHLRGRRWPGLEERTLFYYTLGEERWKQTATWPPPGLTPRRLHLAAGGRLNVLPPVAATGSDRYEVDFSATTGPRSRWHTELDGGEVAYRERAAAARQLLVYTSDPLDEDLEITGHPVALLFVRSTHEDGSFHVYLEEVAPDGAVTYLVEGQLRARDRRLASSAADEVLGPRHSHRRVDAAPLVPGELAELHVALYPISVCVSRGHRLRLAIAGADAGLFERVPARGDPVITLERTRAHPSHLELPVKPSRCRPS
jgi:uncharacterized protein